MNNFLKKAFSYDFALDNGVSDGVVGDHAILDRDVDDWGNEWESASSSDAHQDVDFLKMIANR